VATQNELTPENVENLLEDTAPPAPETTPQES
jgi:hypothetical protein